jgi:hypothetical protein
VGMQHSAEELGQIARVESKMDAGFARLEERFDAFSREQQEMKLEVKKTNGRVTALEVQRAVDAALSISARDHAAALKDQDSQLLTRGGAKFYVVLVIATVAATVGVLQFIGWGG